jgi:outer membrane autotransporter protein
MANGVLVRPFAAVGATHFFSGTNPQITAQSQGAPVGVVPFTVTGNMDRNYTDVGAGVDALAKDGKVLRVAYGGQFGSNTRTNAVALKVSIPF